MTLLIFASLLQSIGIVLHFGKMGGCGSAVIHKLQGQEFDSRLSLAKLEVSLDKTLYPEPLTPCKIANMTPESQVSCRLCPIFGKQEQTAQAPSLHMVHELGENDESVCQILATASVCLLKCHINLL